MNVTNGFWRANTSSDSIIACIVKGACLGGTNNSSCALGYSGILCHDCSGLQSDGSYYARSGDNMCAKCSSPGIEYLKLFGIVSFLFLYVGVMVAMIVRSPSRKNDSSVLLRILTNYFQIIAMVSTLNLNWP